MPKRHHARQVLLPDDAFIAAKRQLLPTFPPYDARQLLADGRAVVRSEQITLDEAVKRAHRRLKARQVSEITQALGLDPKSPTFWRDAFMRLAELHHNVGQLIHRWTPTKRGRNSYWMRLWTQVTFVKRVDAMKASFGERKTFMILAKAKRIGEAWQADRKSRNSPEDHARAAALRQAYYRSKRAIKEAKVPAAKLPPETHDMPQAGLLFMSAFEAALSDIENGWLGGDI